MAGLTLSGLTKGFGAHKVIEGLDLSVRDGEHLTVFGPSGCGKSLLLRLIAGVYEPDAGDIVVGNRSIVDLAPEHRGIGMAFQTFALYPHLTAEQNIASPLEARASKTRDEQVRRVARLLKIEHVLSHRPRELSNGQKQRTALSRALVAEPKLLLLDDPLRNVDAKLRYEMRLELPRLLRASGATVLYVTQDYREAMALGDRVAVILKGRIVQLADPVTIYDAPASIEVARLFGDPTINLIEAEARGGRVSLAGVDVDLLNVPDGPVTLGIRPQHMTVRPGADGPGLPADLLAVNPFNERVVYFMTLPNGREVLASAPSGEGRELAPGPVRLTFEPQAVLAFDTATGLRIGAPAGRA